MEKILAVDPGKFDIKAATREGDAVKTLSYNSRLYQLKAGEHYEAQGQSKFITYQGKQYIIGEQGTETDMSLAKSTILHKVGVMAILADTVSGGEELRLVLGCPASVYKNKDSRQAYKNYITDNGLLNFDTDKKHYEITVASTLVLPETAGVPFIYPQLFKDNMVAVVDLGGLNMNFAIFNNGVVDLESMNTVNHGGYNLENAIKTRLSGKYSLAVSQDIIRKIMQRGYLVIDGERSKESEEILETIYMDFIREIPNIVKSFNYDISLMDVVFVGGTSQLLGERITKVIPHAVVGEDLKWANVLGFLKIAQEKYKR